MSTLNVFITGLWPTADRNGLLSLSSMLGEPCIQMTYDCNPLAYISDVSNADKIQVFAHSFGANTALELINLLGVKEVELLVLLDPVHYWWLGGDFQLPSNVKRSVCIKKSFGLPPSVGIAPSGTCTNMTIPTWNHGDFPKDPRVVAEVMKAVNG